MEGMGDLYLYGHAVEADLSLERWLLMDLSVFRYAMENLNIPRKEKYNWDGTRFYSFNIYDFPVALEFVVSSSHPLHTQQAEMF